MAEPRSSLLAPGAPSWKAPAACLIAAALSACASGPERPASPVSAPQQGVVGAQRTTRPGLTPDFLAGRPLTRIGVLLPFSTVQGEAQSLYDAAEMALFEAGDPYLMLMRADSGGDAAGGAAAAQAVLKNGADIIVGPVLRDGVSGAARPAAQARTPVIGFSTDNAVAGNGAYLLSFPLEEEVSRIVAFAAQKGLTRLAFMAPEGEYGRRVEAAARGQAARYGGAIVASHFYVRGEREAGAAAQILAAAATAAGAQAILIADNGAPLRAIGPGLFQAGIDLQRVKLLGVGWAGGDSYREPMLAGAWYAAPDPAARAAFEQNYRAAYGRAPSRLASLAYDAVGLTAQLTKEAGGAGLTRAALERPDGFNGADGLFRFRADGTIERALAILEVRAGGAAMIEPPKAFGAGS